MNSTMQPDRASAAAAFRRHVSPDALANRHVRHFVHEALKLCLPDQIYWSNGSAYERGKLIEGAMTDGALTPADVDRLPGCYLQGGGGGPCGAHDTFVCTAERGEAAPADNWMGSPAARDKVRALFDRCMVGRTMYVVPFTTGPWGSSPARAGVLITDSVFAALRTGAMTRAGDVALKALGEDDDFARCLHTVGVGDGFGGGDGPRNAGKRYVFRFPHENATYSFGTTHPFGREELFATTPPAP